MYVYILDFQKRAVTTQMGLSWRVGFTRILFSQGSCLKGWWLALWAAGGVGAVAGFGTDLHILASASNKKAELHSHVTEGSQVGTPNQFLNPTSELSIASGSPGFAFLSSSDPIPIWGSWVDGRFLN